MCVTIFNYLTVFCWLVGSHWQFHRTCRANLCIVFHQWDTLNHCFTNVSQSLTCLIPYVTRCAAIFIGSMLCPRGKWRVMRTLRAVWGGRGLGPGYLWGLLWPLGDSSALSGSSFSSLLSQVVIFRPTFSSHLVSMFQSEESTTLTRYLDFLIWVVFV